MGFLQPATKKGGKSSSGGIKLVVNGKQLRFNKETAEAIGLKDHVNVYLGEAEDGEENRLYFLTNQRDASQFKLNGKDGKQRMFQDSNIVTVARLGSDEYPLTKDKRGYFLEFNPDNPVPSFEKRVKVPRDPNKVKKDLNKATGPDAQKENAKAFKGGDPKKKA